MTFVSRLLLLLMFIFMSSTSASPSSKTVYLIRHAESEENRRIASLSRCFRSLAKLSLPSSADVTASTELLNVYAQVDSNVSEIGKKQIAEMGDKLKQADFITSTGIQLVAHSPLLRARQTSEGMLGCVAPDIKSVPVDRVVEVDLLAEKTPQEWTPLCYGGFIQRIANFEQWLGEQPEKAVAIVGHSQYFKTMLGLNFKFGNCDVWEVTFDPSKRVGEPKVIDSSTAEESVRAHENKEEERIEEKGSWTLPPQWSSLKQLYKCQVESSKK